MPRLFSSLRAALLVPFVGVVILVAASISLLSYQTGLRAVDELSEQLLLDISNRVTQATSRHLASSSVMLNAVVPELATSGNDGVGRTDLVPATLGDFERRMWIALNLFPTAGSYIYYGSHEGEFVGLERKSEHDYEVRWREANAPQRSIFATEGPGERSRLLRTDGYDPRVRPWFKEAAQRGMLTWSSVYVDYTTRALTVTLAKPVFTPQRVQRGVVATDVALTALTDFVRGLQVSRTGVAFIVERDGSLIASSGGDQLFGSDNGRPTRLHASESSNPLVRAAWAALQSPRERSLDVVRGIEIARHSLDGPNGRVHMSATAQRDGAGLDWTMVVAIPRADHMGNVQRTIIQNVLIALVAIGLAIASGLWITHRISGDVQRLSEATRLLARGQSPERLFRGRRDELGVIARAMEDFKEGLLVDPLTGALTRTTFEKRVAAYREHQSVGERAPFAVVFIDLDRFKSINDAHGHAVGDAVLAIIARRIASTLRNEDILGRYGGDEFVLMLPGLHDAATLDARMRQLSAALAQPITVGDVTLRSGASCGGARCPDDGVTLDDLVRAADARMYEAKAQRPD